MPLSECLIERIFAEPKGTRIEDNNVFNSREVESSDYLK